MSDNDPADGMTWDETLYNHKKDGITEIRERSKNDKKIIVGSEIRVICDIADTYRIALEKISKDISYHVLENNLDDVYLNKIRKIAEDALC